MSDSSNPIRRGRIWLAHAADQPVCCVESGCERPLHDHGPGRFWRHLNTMQFATVLTARVPRTACPDSGVKYIKVPWAEPHGRFTLMSEAFAIRLLQSASSFEAARMLLKLSCGSVQRIMDRAVERGLAERKVDEVKHVSLDEKSFGKGQAYVSIMTDIDGQRVLVVASGRDEDAVNQSWDQKDTIQAITMGMWQPYKSSLDEHVPDTSIVHDRFHLSKYLNGAADKVRRQEHKALTMEGDETLKGTRQLWL